MTLNVTLAPTAHPESASSVEVPAPVDSSPFVSLPPPLESDFETLPAVQVLLAYLEREGVDAIFGIPGGPLMPFFEGIFDRGKIRPIIAKHEGGAAFMADGYARVSGRLGVCCATTGPGATNALTGIACAYRDSVPVLLVTAQVALSAFGKGAAQESSPLGIDIVDMFRDVTKASVMLMMPEKIGDVTRHLLRAGLSGRPGPIHLSLPADMMKTEAPSDQRRLTQSRSPSELFDRQSVKDASKLLLRAKHPVILAGYGVHISRGYDELRAVAERLTIPVATTPKAKGVFPEDHPLSLGVFGMAGSPQADAAILSKDTDLLLAIGTSFGEASCHAWDTRVGSERWMLQIDVDPREIGKNYPVDVALVGNAKPVLKELDYELRRETHWLHPHADLESRGKYIQKLKQDNPRCYERAAMESTSLPLRPQRVIGELRQAMPSNGILFVDIGNVMAWALHYFQVKEPGTFFINMGFGSMGHAVAGAIGGKMAAPTRPVVALVGDASFAMNGMEVHTAVENNIPVVWVVMNNSGHGMVHMGESLQFKGKFSTSLFNHRVDAAGIAEAVGALAFRAERPGEVETAVRAAIQSGRPSVVDVRIDISDRPPLGIRLATLERFFKGR
jgi:acetolactate synthase-1/2/3 large subunit